MKGEGRGSLHSQLTALVVHNRIVRLSLSQLTLSTSHFVSIAIPTAQSVDNPTVVV